MPLTVARSVALHTATDAIAPPICGSASLTVVSGRVKVGLTNVPPGGWQGLTVLASAPSRTQGSTATVPVGNEKRYRSTYPTTWWLSPGTVVPWNTVTRWISEPVVRQTTTPDAPHPVAAGDPQVTG